MEDDGDEPIPRARMRDLWTLLRNPWGWPFEIALALMVGDFIGALSESRAATMKSFLEGLFASILALPSNQLFQVGFILFAIFAFRKAVLDTRRAAANAHKEDQAHRERALNDLKPLLEIAAGFPRLLAYRAIRQKELLDIRDTVEMVVRIHGDIDRNFRHYRSSPTPEMNWTRLFDEISNLIGMINGLERSMGRPNTRLVLNRPRLVLSTNPNSSERMVREENNVEQMDYLDNFWPSVGTAMAESVRGPEAIREEVQQLNVRCQEQLSVLIDQRLGGRPNDGE